MKKMDAIQTTFEEAACPVPGQGNEGGTFGGFDLGAGSAKETPGVIGQTVTLSGIADAPPTLSPLDDPIVATQNRTLDRA